MGNNLSYINKPAFLRKLYRSIIFANWFRIAKMDEKGQGAVERSVTVGNMRKRRDKVFILFFFLLGSVKPSDILSIAS